MTWSVPCSPYLEGVRVEKEAQRGRCVSVGMPANGGPSTCQAAESQSLGYEGWLGRGGGVASRFLASFLPMTLTPFDLECSPTECSLGGDWDLVGKQNVFDRQISGICQHNSFRQTQAFPESRQ